MHTPFEKALQTLNAAMQKGPLSDLERDGAIQRFEFCVELAWKTSKRKLEQNAIEVDSPRDVFRKAASSGWIDDATPWFKFLEAKNKTSHSYREEIAKEIFAIIPEFMHLANGLLSKLKTLT
jgi:nucleotidyltransferase substrate binding protein (TIGR01987 family)